MLVWYTDDCIICKEKKKQPCNIPRSVIEAHHQSKYAPSAPSLRVNIASNLFNTFPVGVFRVWLHAGPPLGDGAGCVCVCVRAGGEERLFLKRWRASLDSCIVPQGSYRQPWPLSPASTQRRTLLYTGVILERARYSSFNSAIIVSSPKVKDVNFYSPSS